MKAVKSDPMKSDPLSMGFGELVLEWRLATSGPVQRWKPNDVSAPTPSGEESGGYVAYLIVEDALDRWGRTVHERAAMRLVLIQIADRDLHLLGARGQAACWRAAFGNYGVLVARSVASFARRVLEEREKRRAQPARPS